MGQRSQIYVRVTDRDGKKHFIANYYQWNYQERMISRARYGIEWIKKTIYYLHYHLEELERILDVNFDMKDISIHQNLVEEYKEYSNEWNFKDFVLTEMDNNDGKLLIDVDQKTETVKYAFLDWNADSDNIMDGNAYMKWDSCTDKRWDEPTEYFDQDDIDICKENIKEIAEMATLMTKEEVEDFINDDYEKILGLESFKQMEFPF